MECGSYDTSLGIFPTMEECAYACKVATECHFFIYGKDSKAGDCYHEHTKTADCTEGFEADDYDFAEFTGTLCSNKYCWNYFINK